MSYLLLGISSLAASAAFLAWFRIFPRNAAIFPILIVIACFIVPGIAALFKGVKNGELAKLTSEVGRGVWKRAVAEMKTKKFGGLALLFLLTVLYVVGTHYIGFFPVTVLYFLIVLFGIYRMPVKGTLIYTLCSVAFLYVFFVIIFKVKV